MIQVPHRVRCQVAHNLLLRDLPRCQGQVQVIVGMMRVVAKDKAVGERYEEGRGDHTPRDAAGRSAVSKCETTHLMSAAW